MNVIDKCCNVSSNYIIQESFKVCSICGKVNSDYLDFSSSIVYTEPETTNSKSHGYINSKLSKILKWNMYSKEDKNQYKLKKSVKELIQKFNFNENIVSSVCDLVVSVIKSVGSKRAKIKESIIIICTYYILKYNNINNYTQYHLAELVGLETKSISKADKIILEFINLYKENDNLNTQRLFNANEKSIDYIINIIKKFNLDISDNIIEKTEQLIIICEDNDILLDHTPLSIGVACFYYILKERNTTIDMKLFSEIYSQSIVTINKTYSKLVVFREKLNKLLEKL
jgi:transcription initiation factor TFIIIB Brf1 subunit/transcription initiation factor TFIIB